MANKQQRLGVWGEMWGGMWGGNEGGNVGNGLKSQCDFSLLADKNLRLDKLRLDPTAFRAFS